MKIILYINTNIQGICNIDDEFKPMMDIINDTCKQFDFTCVITSSKRASTLVKGAIVTPAQMSNHLVGHAIDCNLKNNKTGEYYNSKKMGDGIGTDECVIKAIEAKGIRWGGEFRAKDEVHFDDSINLKNPDHWHLLNNTLNSHNV